MSCGIYKIISKINDKEYIGSSCDIEHRFYIHLNDLKNQKHHNEHIQRAYNKYGKNNLVLEISELCNKEDLLIKEQYYLDTLKPYINGLNVSEYADRPPSWLGKKHTEETKRKISEGNKGKIISKKQRKQVSVRHKGKKISDEQKKFLSDKFSGEGNNMYGISIYDVWLEKYGEKVANEKLENWKNNIRKSNIGRIVSEETRKKISVAKKGKRNSDEAIEKMRQSKIGTKASDETKRKMSEQRRGENNPACKLKDKDVIEILKMLNDGVRVVELSKKYDVSTVTIRNIKKEKRKI